MKGTIKSYKGWTLDGVPQDRGTNISKAKLKVPYPSVKSPAGDTYTVEHLTKFCAQHNLSLGCMSELLRGKKKSHKGWTLTE